MLRGMSEDSNRKGPETEAESEAESESESESDPSTLEIQREQQQPRRGDIALRTLVMGAAVIIIIAGLKLAAGILLPILVAAFLAVISIPPINWLARHHIPRWAATLIVFTGVLAGLGGVSLFVGSSVADFASSLDIYEASLKEQFAGVLTWVETQPAAEQLNIDISTDALLEKLDAGKAMALVGDAVGAVTSMASNTLFVLITVIFILAEAAGYRDKLQVAFGSTSADLGQYQGVLDDLQVYLAVKTQVSLVTGVLAGVGCWILGIDYALLWGLVAFLLNYVPTLGSIIAAIPAVLLALVQFGWERALIIAVIYVAINMVMGSVLEPRMMGKRLGLSPLVVVLSLVFWGFVWGPVGMVLCVPLTMLVKILLQNSPELRWIAVFLGSSAEARQRLERMEEASPTATPKAPAT